MISVKALQKHVRLHKFYVENLQYYWKTDTNECCYLCMSSALLLEVTSAIFAFPISWPLIELVLKMMIE